MTPKAVSKREALKSRHEQMIRDRSVVMGLLVSDVMGLLVSVVMGLLVVSRDGPAGVCRDRPAGVCRDRPFSCVRRVRVSLDFGTWLDLTDNRPAAGLELFVVC